MRVFWLGEMRALINIFLSPNTLFFCFSAGAGRTGTFIALSNILERVKAEGLLDVFQTVKSLRMQRPHMVQTVVGGRQNIKSAALKEKKRERTVTPLLPSLPLPPGAIRLLLQSGPGFCWHLLRLRQLQIKPACQIVPCIFLAQYLMHFFFPLNVVFSKPSCFYILHSITEVHIVKDCNIKRVVMTMILEIKSRCTPGESVLIRKTQSVPVVQTAYKQKCAFLHGLI